MTGLVGQSYFFIIWTVSGKSIFQGYSGFIPNLFQRTTEANFSTSGLSERWFAAECSIAATSGITTRELHGWQYAYGTISVYTIAPEQQAHFLAGLAMEERLAKRITAAFGGVVGTVTVDGKMHDIPHLKAEHLLLGQLEATRG